MSARRNLAGSRRWQKSRSADMPPWPAPTGCGSRASSKRRLPPPSRPEADGSPRCAMTTESCSTFPPSPRPRWWRPQSCSPRSQARNPYGQESRTTPIPENATCSRSLTRRKPCAPSPPDLQAIARLPVGGLIVTAKRRAGGVVSRYFTPAYGIPEDPVTGSAHCTIAPYWRNELGTTLPAEQASPRGGQLTVVTTDAERVLLAGKAHTAATEFIL